MALQLRRFEMKGDNVTLIAFIERLKHDVELIVGDGMNRNGHRESFRFAGGIIRL
jgi:hypothetical protein